MESLSLVGLGFYDLFPYIYMSLGQFLGVHEASLLGEEVEFYSFSDSYFACFAAHSNQTISPSSKFQIKQTQTLNCRARRDLQLWYSNFLHLTSLRSPKQPYNLLLSRILRISGLIFLQAILISKNSSNIGLYLSIRLQLALVLKPAHLSINPIFKKSFNVAPIIPIFL